MPTSTSKPTATNVPTSTPTPTATKTATPQVQTCSEVTVSGATFLQTYQGQHGTNYLYKVDSGAKVRLVANLSSAGPVEWKANHSLRLANGGSFSFPNPANTSIVDWTAPVNTSVAAEGVDVRGDTSNDPWRYCPTITFGVWPQTPTVTATATAIPATATRTNTPTVTATRTLVPSPTATATFAPAPYVQFLNPSHTLSHPNGITYAKASEATLSITGIGNRFELKLFRLKDEKVIASQTYKEVSSYEKQTTFCLFGKNGNNCKGWPEESFLPGSYQFQAIAYQDLSYNSNFRQVFLQIDIQMPEVTSLTEANGRLIIRGKGFRTYTGGIPFSIEVSSKDTNGIIKPEWNPGTVWNDGEISLPKPTWFPKNGTITVWVNTLKSESFKYNLGN
ncbi:MAG: hypothetical protein HY376_02410 [Candidatus Blackburnbacteria bacterium]|nr:hypothetical protein [Candidatus Blackburnbacteria bacterium]